MSEHDEQCCLVSWARLYEEEHPELKLLHAIPNGGWRSKRTAALLHLEGVKAGVPDLCLPAPRAPWHGLYIEMKVKGGHVRKEQREWIQDLRDQGYRVEVCYGWEAARDAILDYLGKS